MAQISPDKEDQELPFAWHDVTKPILIQVKVKPSARVSALTQVEDGTWLAQLKSPPVDGKANAELISLVAGHFNCRKSAVSIKSGASGRLKWVRIESG